MNAEYLEYALRPLARVVEVTTRKMMGEHLLYSSGKLFGGAHYGWFLAKGAETSQA